MYDENMKNSIFKMVKKFVTDTFVEAGDKHGVKHLLRTAYWMKFLRPDIDEAALVAAISHDIQRGYKKEEKRNFVYRSSMGFLDKEFLKHHQNYGAKIIYDWLKDQGIDKDFRDRVAMLISRHEVGGNNDQNLLKDADSISFFECNVDHFLTTKVLESGREKVREKFDWMFNRITSLKAKQIAKPMYESALEQLEIVYHNRDI